jgi:hypothetical protein
MRHRFVHNPNDPLPFLDYPDGWEITTEERQIVFLSPDDMSEEQARTMYEELIHGPTPLDQAGSLATLLAVLSLATVEDAANAVDLTPQQLVDEADAWQAMKGTP